MYESDYDFHKHYISFLCSDGKSVKKREMKRKLRICLIIFETITCQNT